MDTKQTVIKKLQSLSAEKQQEVLDFVEFLEAKVKREASVEASESESALEAAGDLVGCVEGPEDLSINKKYLEGFGQS